jgi:hypothetical protein
MKASWPSPLEKLRWTQGFRDRVDVVTGDDGRKFRCIYEDDTVLIRPMDGGYVPMGHLPLDLVTTEEWLYEDSDPVFKSMVAEFLTSDDAGVSVKAEWPKFKDRSVKFLERKFKEVNAPGVDVIVRDDAVFLVKRVHKPK